MRKKRIPRRVQINGRWCDASSGWSDIPDLIGFMTTEQEYPFFPTVSRKGHFRKLTLGGKQ
jgi:hypothetical protein